MKGNSIIEVYWVNFLSHARPHREKGSSHASWESVTRGGFSGFKTWLSNPRKGVLPKAILLIKSQVEAV